MKQLILGALLVPFLLGPAHADEKTADPVAALNAVGDNLEPVLVALVKQGDKALPVLTQAMADWRPQVRSNASVVAGRLGKTAWPLLGLLDEALSDDHTGVRTASARALGRIVQDRHPSGGDPIEEVLRINWIVQRLLKLAGEKREWGRDGALQGLALMGWPAAVTLDNFLDEREMRQAAFNAVLALGVDGKATIERWLRHPKWRVRAWTAHAVGTHKGTALDVGALLAKVLRDDASAVVVAAARALEYRVRKGDDAVLVAMAEGLATPHATAHNWLATGLQRAKTLPNAAVAPILRHLARIAPGPRSLLCAALGKAQVHKDEAVSALLPQLKADTIEVRYGAAAGLAGLGKAPEAALAPLIEAVRAGGQLTKPYSYARHSLYAGGKKWHGFRPLRPSAAAPALRLHRARGASALRAAMDADPRPFLVDALAGLGAHARPELQGLLSNREPEIARRAAVALAWLPEPTPASVPILLACIEKRDESEVIEEPVVSADIDWHQTALDALEAGGVELLPAVLEELVLADAKDRARLRAALGDYIVALGKPASTHLEALRVHPELGSYADELGGRIEAEAKKAAAAKKAAKEKKAAEDRKKGEKK